MNKNNDKHAEYYEAILQIRPAKKEAIDFIYYLINSRNDTKISKIEELKTGVDIYITNQKFARGTLAKQLKKKFKNSRVIISKSLYGQHKMTSKLVYRATVLVRLT